MRTTPILLGLSLLLSACPSADGDEGEGGNELTDSADASDESEGQSEEATTDTSEGESGETSSGDPALDCANGCAAQVTCGILDEGELEGCTQRCEAQIEASAQIFGSACADARLAEALCSMNAACEGAVDDEACVGLTLEALLVCSEPQVAELAALCECNAAGEPDEPGSLSAVQICAVETAEFAIDGYIDDGQACLDAYPAMWACMAAACEDESCAQEPPPESCACAEEEAILAAACPSSG
ncbi:hypothetical protein G6O69_37395 [Pseudenhygromyxa sp. WMMC2535]|uniref:hypothetical protein n=1 Tax=Pseudenhygromyxa sp. WMMC2535 TaxID=2712867 RepID=UPI001552CCB9|nr:hypothetical protein [Pseudenhygromyxa sp. WMMC2535]NVB40357.1 hypothetical protein [Pseudenhygromyxa sp. WMMC2535]NVB43551.1 hypothetical protein [Pseudenhygromyxa sp. WMMC2535]